MEGNTGEKIAVVWLCGGKGGGGRICGQKSYIKRNYIGKIKERKRKREVKYRKILIEK